MKLKTDLLFGLRTLRRSPWFACVAVLTLALGIGANTALFSVVRAVLMRSYGYREPVRLAQIPNLSIPDMRAMQERARSFERIGTARMQTFTLLGPREPENFYGQLVSAECFAVLGATPRMGRVFADADFESGAPPVAVIGYSLWQTSFDSDPAILGRRVLLNGVEHTVIGVMPVDFEFPHPVMRVWAPWRFTPADLSNRNLQYTLFARLRGGVTREAAQVELHGLSQSLAAEFPATNKDRRAVMEPVNEHFVGGYRTVLYTLLGAVGFVLLIACMNVSNLLMARGIDRSREMTIRSALGAPRLRLIRQLLTESVLLAGLGGVLGLLFARWWLALLNSLLPVRTFSVLPGAERASLDLRVLGIALLMTVAAGAIAGIVPAVRASGSARVDRGSPARSRFLIGLIVVESALSIVLLAGAGLLIRSFNQLLHVDPGFRPEQVLTVQIPSEWTSNSAPTDPAVTARRKQYFKEIVTRVQAIPGVTAAAITTVLPLGSVQINTRIFLQGRPDETLRLAYRAVTPDYFRAMGIPVVRGRAFTDEDHEGGPRVVIVSQAFAQRYWPDQDPLGKQLTLGDARTGPWSTVAGVVGSVRYDGLTRQAGPELYTSYQQTLLAAQFSSIVLRTARDPAGMAPAVRETVRQLNRNQPVTEVKPLTKVVSDASALARLYTILLSIFAGIAMLLASAGISSVISWTVSRSTREIGIRMALGADARDVMLSAVRRAILAVIAGVVVGLAGAAALLRLLKTQLFEVTATDPGTYAAVSILLIVAACIAAYIPARRAARVDPMMALRSE